MSSFRWKSRKIANHEFKSTKLYSGKYLGSFYQLNCLVRRGTFVFEFIKDTEVIFVWPVPKKKLLKIKEIIEEVTKCI